MSPNPAPLGSPITVDGSGCTPGSAITFTLNGALQAQSTATAVGTFTFRWTPAIDHPAGTFPLVLSCGGQSSTHTYTISEGTIGGGGGNPRTLPFTGRDVGPTTIAGSLLIVLGSAALLVARRRDSLG